MGGNAKVDATPVKTGWKGVKNMDLETWKEMRVRALQEKPTLDMAQFIKKLFDYYVANNF